MGNPKWREETKNKGPALETLANKCKGTLFVANIVKSYGNHVFIYRAYCKLVGE
ncbi:hypothetical protein PMIT1342_02325 [Prochlorococcus marinus str. MIT 1342]|nr:hypothetical protein PMIT1342_02325 [Prochlorococcus marinus str. MIT 1342]